MAVQHDRATWRLATTDCVERFRGAYRDLATDLDSLERQEAPGEDEQSRHEWLLKRGLGLAMGLILLLTPEELASLQADEAVVRVNAFLARD